jgi:hypothetical protein
MDFGKQKLQQQEAARQMMYQNPGYQFERRNMKAFTLTVDNSDNILSTPEDFSQDLHEPLKIDKLSDIYLDNFTTYNCKKATNYETSGFVLQLNEFNIQTNSTNPYLFNKIFIPNEAHEDRTNQGSAIIHKGKKLNYICSINPRTLSTISGKITGLSSVTPLFDASGCAFIAEFIIVNRD